ncbi:ribonuclease P protein component [Candidatus Wolfebacteria bacterium]|nr:ribonuclease P protein component [Candidatus Wolfebacteria bacterium]
MLAKKFRLPLQGAPAGGFRTIRGDFFVLKKRKSDLPLSRLAVLAGKKIDKRSARRNKIKRTIVNFCEKKKINLAPGFDFLIIGQPKLSFLTEEEIRQELKKIFSDDPDLKKYV